MVEERFQIDIREVDPTARRFLLAGTTGIIRAGIARASLRRGLRRPAPMKKLPERARADAELGLPEAQTAANQFALFDATQVLRPAQAEEFKDGRPARATSEAVRVA